MNHKRKTHSIFLKILKGYLTGTFMVIVLTGLGSYWLVRQNIIHTNLSELMTKSEAVSDMLSRKDGRVRVLTPGGLDQMEHMVGAQLIYVDSDMVARQMPVRRFHKMSSIQGSDGEDGEKSNGLTQLPKAFPTLTPREVASGAVLGNQFTKPSPDAVIRKTPARTPIEKKQSPAARMEEESQTDVLDQFDMAGSVDEQLIRSIMGGEAATDIKKLEFMPDPVLFAGRPIVDSESGDVLAAVILCRPISEVREAVMRMVGMLAIAAAAALVCATALAWFMSRRIARPISDLSVIAGHMAEGYYGERYQVDTGDEIGQLGMTLNLLSGRLAEVIGNLNDEKSKLEKILSAIGEGIIAVDREGRVIHHNGAALNLLELKAWEIRPDHSNALVHRQQLLDMLRTSMTDRERTATSWEMVNGRTIEAIAFPVISEDAGELSGAVCLMRDISETQKLEQMRRDYIANISHELRTPLTGIRGMTEPLLDGLMETEEERQSCYRIIYQETVRLEKLIGEMLDLSRLQAGRIQLELEPMDAKAMLNAAAGRMRSRAEEGKIELRVETPENIVVMGDENRMLQVLIILTDNALSFTPPGGKVTLFAYPSGEKHVCMGVKDTGCGISPADLPYIWERFYKADRSRMRTRGTGLGLPIAKMVVELMQGKIDVDTKAGEGSTFTFTLNRDSKVR